MYIFLQFLDNSIASHTWLIKPEKKYMQPLYHSGLGGMALKITFLFSLHYETTDIL